MRVFDALMGLRAISALLSQETLYPINTVYKLMLLQNDLLEAEKIILERLGKIFGDDFATKELDSEEILTYNAIMDSEIDIDKKNLSIEEIVLDNANIKVTPQEMSSLIAFFSKKDS